MYIIKPFLEITTDSYTVVSPSFQSSDELSARLNTAVSVIVKGKRRGFQSMT